MDKYDGFEGAERWRTLIAESCTKCDYDGFMSSLAGLMDVCQHDWFHRDVLMAVTDHDAKDVSDVVKQVSITMDVTPRLFVYEDGADVKHTDFFKANEEGHAPVSKTDEFGW